MCVNRAIKNVSSLSRGGLKSDHSDERSPEVPSVYGTVWKFYPVFKLIFPAFCSGSINHFKFSLVNCVNCVCDFQMRLF